MIDHRPTRREPTTGRYPWMTEDLDPIEESGAVEGCDCADCVAKR
jgi:hypothetical protein